jgi:hypothetical protein
LATHPRAGLYCGYDIESLEDMIPNHPDCLRLRELMRENSLSPAFQKLHNDPHFAQLRKYIPLSYSVINCGAQSMSV